MRSVIGFLLLSLCLPSLAEDKVLNIYSWSSYIPEKGLQQFKDQTGIAVKYDVFDSAEALDSKLLTGGSGYDVVFPASSALARAIKAGAVQEVPSGSLPNYANAGQAGRE